MEVKLLFLVHSLSRRIVTPETLLVHSLPLCQSCQHHCRGQLHLCVCLWVLYTVSALTTTCQRAMHLRQPHTEPVVMLFYGSWELLTNTQGKWGGVCEWVSKGAARQMIGKEWGEREDKRKTWRCSLPYRVTLSTCSHTGEGGRMPFCRQMDTDTQTNVHKHTYAYVC